MKFPHCATTDQFEEEKDLIEQILNDVNPESIRSYLQEITREPHIAAQERDEELIQWIKKTWEEVGLDHVDLATYDLYLSWPNKVSSKICTVRKLQDFSVTQIFMKSIL